MTAEDLRKWQKAQGYTYDTAAAALGMGRTTFAEYLKREGELPLWLALACAAIAAGLQPWKNGQA
jgi:transcriptional regulator with XRE-family HTH domain